MNLTPNPAAFPRPAGAALTGIRRLVQSSAGTMTASKMESECRTFAAESFKCLEGHGTNREKAKVGCRSVDISDFCSSRHPRHA